MSKSLSSDLPKSLAVGSMAGLLAGLFGIGGGFIMSPLFVLWLKLNQKKANASSLLAVVFISAAALAGYISADQVSWPAALLVTTGAVLGMFFGVRIFQRVSAQALTYLFACLLILVAARLLWSTTPHQLFTGVSGQVVLVVIGILSGALAGLLGVGGGIVIVPALIICSGVLPEVARGSSLVAICVSALIGTFLHNRNNQVDWQIAIPAGISGIPSGLLGVYLSLNISEQILIPMFCLLLTALSMQLFFTNRVR